MINIDEKVAYKKVEINSNTLYFFLLSIIIFIVVMDKVKDDIVLTARITNTEFIVIAIIMLVRYISLRKLSKLKQSYEKKTIRFNI